MEIILEAILNAVLEFIIEPLLAIVGYLLLTLLVYVVGLPLLCLVCTPVVLIAACFGPGIYGDKVVSGYKGIMKVAINHGGFVGPLH